MKTSPKTRRAGGQALIEMVVAMVVIVAIIAGLLQIARMAMAHTEAMHEARRLAGERAMLASPGWDEAAFIRDWHPGPDGAAYSRDDILLPAAPSDFTLTIPAAARPHELNRYRPGNPVSVIAGLGAPQQEFHLVQGDTTREVPAPPAVRSLIYDAETIDVRGEAWLIRTGGIY